VPEQQHGFADGCDDRDHVTALILEIVVLARRRFASTTAGDRVHREVALEDGLHEFPVRSVVAECPVHQYERGTGTGFLVGDRDVVRSLNAMHRASDEG
jgi:hypothetical protein